MHVNTLVAVLVLLSLAIGLGLLAARSRFPDSHRTAAGIWAASMLSAAGGFALYLAADSEAGIALRLPSELLVSLSLALRVDAARRLAGSRMPAFACHLGQPVVLAIVLLLQDAHTDIPLRIGLLSLVYGAMLLPIVPVALGRWSDAGAQPADQGLRVIAFFQGVTALLLLVRGALQFTGTPTILDGLHVPTPFNLALFLWETVALIGALGGLGVSVMGRMRERDEALHRVLRHALDIARVTLWQARPEPSADPGIEGQPQASDLLPRVHPDERGDMAEFLAQARVDGASATASIQARLADADGQWRWQEFTLRADDPGRDARVILVSRDVDKKKRAELALAQATRRLEDALRAVGMVSWSLDPATGRLQSSGDSRHVLGRETTTWAALREDVLPGDLARFDHAHALALAHDEPMRVEFDLRDPEGGTRTVMMQGRRVRGAGEEAGMLYGVLQDVTDQRTTEAALRATQQHLWRALDGARMVIWEWDVATGIRRAYGDEVQLYGFRPRSAAEIDARLHPDDAAEARAVFQAAIDEGSDYRHEYRVVRPDGQVRWLNAVGRSERGGDGAVASVSGVAWDITERKRTEQALRDSQERMLFAFEAAQMYAWEHSLVDGSRVAVGDQMVLGCSPTSRAEHVALIHPDDRARDVECFLRAIGNGTAYESEYRIVRPDGAVRWIGARGRPQLDPRRRVVAIGGVAIDVTARRIAERELAESERLRRLAGLAARLNFWTLDLDSGERIGDELDHDFYGTAVRSLQQWERLLEAEDSDSLGTLIMEVREGRELGELEYRLRDPDGRWRWFLLLGQRVHANDTHLLVGVTREITAERRRDERLRQAMEGERAASEAKSRFLAIMSHEIRTPLNGVLGSARLLEDAVMDAHARALVATLRRSGEFLLAIINDILDFSKIEAGKLRLESIPLTIEDCVDAAVELLAPQARERRLRLVACARGDAARAVLGDPMRLQQILVNLLSNALKFSHEGGVRVQADVEDRQDVAHVRLEVRDTGEGMSDEVQASLFESFRQGDVSTTRRHGGTGLGLAITGRLVDLMQGEIEVSSAPGAGATFAVRLAMPWADPAPMRRAPSAWTGRRVWLVVADPFARDALACQLESLGAALVAGPGSDAEPWDTVVVDEPGAAAFPVLEHIVGAGPALEVLALSDSSDWCLALEQRLGRAVRRLGHPVRPGPVRRGLEAAGPVAPVDDRSASTSRPEGSLRLMVVEDNPVNAAILSLMIESLGYRAEHVTHGEEAVARARETDYDLILMDVEMPGMDGLEATRAIRRFRGGRERPWIVAVSAHVFDGSRERMAEAGMNDFVAKPVRIDELSAVLVAATLRNGADRPVASG